jgi:hypothetical protein
VSATFAQILLQRGGRGFPVGPGGGGGGGDLLGLLLLVVAVVVLGVALAVVALVIKAVFVLLVGVWLALVFVGAGLLQMVAWPFRRATSVQRFLIACGLFLLALLVAVGVVAALCATGDIDRSWLRAELLSAVCAVLG